ncbi:helix-turn-helix domain-containing protein [Streptomyces sp. NPDC017454]|uniref:helix-turn-helix domain-containing protein n=1 Tax=unclassified Streptomyces TaxID=2593676 RepID=UPI0033297870
MTEDRTKWQWARLGDAIKAARETRGLRQIDLAERAGVSEGTVQNLEGGETRSRMPQSLAKVEPHLGWEPGSGLAVLRGGDPVLTPVAHEVSADLKAGKDRLRDKLPLRVVDELESDDPLLDSQVIQLPGIPGARMTVVVHGSPDATPEEIQEALIAWRRAERSLQRLPDSPGDEPRAANGQ